MKKTLLIIAMALGITSANAQTISLSTYTGTDISKYDNEVRTVSASRYVFTGWNTINLPFALTTAQINETFGEDCKLEKLVGVESDGAQIKLNFKDCKEEGIMPNTPYILHYTGEPGNKRIIAENITLLSAPARTSFSDVNGVTVNFTGAQLKKDAQGLYGILAKDNSEATFVNVDHITTGFYATRCYIELSNGNSTILTTNHVSGELTGIDTILKGSAKADVYNLSGVKVATKLTAAGVNTLPAGVYVVNNKKVLVK